MPATFPSKLCLGLGENRLPILSDGNRSEINRVPKDGLQRHPPSRDMVLVVEYAVRTQDHRTKMNVRIGRWARRIRVPVEADHFLTIIRLDAVLIRGGPDLPSAFGPSIFNEAVLHLHRDEQFRASARDLQRSRLAVIQQQGMNF